MYTCLVVAEEHDCYDRYFSSFSSLIYDQKLVKQGKQKVCVHKLVVSYKMGLALGG